MKKPAALIFLLSLLLNVLGYLIIYYIQLWNIHLNVGRLLKAGTFKSAQTIFIIDQNNERFFNWENDGEFEFKDKMYDVINKEIRGGLTIVHCISDLKESELVKEFSRQTGRQHSKIYSFCQQVLLNLYHPVNLLGLHYFPEKLNFNHLAYFCYFKSHISETVSPPPWPTN